MIELLVLILCGKVIWAFMRSANAYQEQRYLARTWKNLSSEGRAQVVAHYQQMKSDGRI